MVVPLALWFLSIVLVCYHAVAHVLRLARWRSRSRGRPLPPGPTGMPIVGNALCMRQPELWKAYQTLCKTYGQYCDLHTMILNLHMYCGTPIGDVVHLSAFGEHIVVLGSEQAICDLLDKQSVVTSDRRQHHLLELCVYI